MTKDDFILRSITKLKHKRWEYFIISRIIHQLINEDIEFVTQQYVKRAITEEDKRKYALTDIFFPQFSLHLEIDEIAHSSEKNIDADLDRQTDIIERTEHQVYRIKTFEESPEVKVELPLSTIAKLTDRFICELKRRKREQGTNFEPWDFFKKYDPERFIRKGFIELEHAPRFRYQHDALRLFGYTGGVYQKAVWRVPPGRITTAFVTDKPQTPMPAQESPAEPERAVWFPKFFANSEWQNQLSEDGRTITEEYVSKSRKPAYQFNSDQPNRIVFAHRLNPLGQKVYRFFGEFEPDFSASRDGLAIFRLVSNRVNLDWARGR